MRALVAAGDIFAATRVRTMLAKESLICDVGQTSAKTVSCSTGSTITTSSSSTRWRQASKVTSYCSRCGQRVYARRY